MSNHFLVSESFVPFQSLPQAKLRAWMQRKKERPLGFCLLYVARKGAVKIAKGIVVM